MRFLWQSQHIEFHAAYTKTNFPRVLHFSAFILCCMHAYTVSAPRVCTLVPSLFINNNCLLIISREIQETRESQEKMVNQEMMAHLALTLLVQGWCIPYGVRRNAPQTQKLSLKDLQHHLTTMIQVVVLTTCACLMSQDF